MQAVGSKENRCPWCGDDPLYVAYHDQEWGVPLRDSRALFELLCLEGMQAGLSWLLVLKRRAYMREALLRFEPEALANRGPDLLAKWLADPGLIRNRSKLEALTTNARAWLALEEPFANLVWSVVDGVPRQNQRRSLSETPAGTAASTALSKQLKSKGFQYVGPVICYAFMQSAGLVNDHLVDCPAHARCAALA